MPFFVVATMMKIGNHSNDGVKIGSKRRLQDPALEDDCIYANYEEASTQRSPGHTPRNRNMIRCLWKHTLPIGGLLHAISAICFLLPRILMEAPLISHGLLPRGEQSCFLIGNSAKALFMQRNLDDTCSRRRIFSLRDVVVLTPFHVIFGLSSCELYWERSINLQMEYKLLFPEKLSFLPHTEYSVVL